MKLKSQLFYLSSSLSRLFFPNSLDCSELFSFSSSPPSFSNFNCWYLSLDFSFFLSFLAESIAFCLFSTEPKPFTKLSKILITRHWPNDLDLSFYYHKHSSKNCEGGLCPIHNGNLETFIWSSGRYCPFFKVLNSDYSYKFSCSINALVNFVYTYVEKPQLKIKVSQIINITI